jgi:putative transposase
MTTYKYRIKDSSHVKWLKSVAGTVNHIWNKTQELKLKHHEDTGKWLSYCDLQKQIKIPNINSQVVQRVIREYTNKCVQFKTPKLKWRTAKRNLGWIPCTNQNVRIDGQTGNFCFSKRNFKVWFDRAVLGKIVTVSLNEDARGRWYINISCENSDKKQSGNRVIGIDLGCKDQVVCSDGVKYTRENLSRKYAENLKSAQRANKRRLCRTIHAKIKNSRLDWNHKTTTQICNSSKIVIVGDISSKKLMKTRFSKSISDASHCQIKTMLLYKAIRHGMEVKVVSERLSTVTCSNCSSKSGPSGLSALGVRQWSCSNCGATHDRDVNAALNILLSVKDI